MEYSDIYIKRIRKLCNDRGIAINKLAVMSDVKQSTLDNIYEDQQMAPNKTK